MTIDKDQILQDVKTRKEKRKHEEIIKQLMKSSVFKFIFFENNNIEKLGRTIEEFVNDKKLNNKIIDLRYSHVYKGGEYPYHYTALLTYRQYE